MVVYLLYSNWMHNGDNVVNEVVGVYDCLSKAQNSLCECIYSELTSHPFANIEWDSLFAVENINIAYLSNLFFDDPEFNFDVKYVKLWNGDDESLSEDYQIFSIEEKELL